MIDGEKIQEIEPHCVGVKALWSPETGIVDWAEVCRSYGRDFTRDGGQIYLNFAAKKFIETPLNADYPVTIMGNDNQEISTKYVLTCGGLQSDLLAKLTGCKPVRLNCDFLL